MPLRLWRTVRPFARLGLASFVLICHLPLVLATVVRTKRRRATDGAEPIVVVSPFEPGEQSGGARAVKDFLALLRRRRPVSLLVVAQWPAPGPVVSMLGRFLSWPLSVPLPCRSLLLGSTALTRRLEGADTLIFEHFSGALCLFWGRPAVRRIVIRDHEVQLRKIEMEWRGSSGIEAATHAVRLACCYLISRPVFSQADCIVTLTHEDRAALLRWFPRLAERTKSIPVPFEEPGALSVDVPEPNAARDLVMIGNFFHRPNVDGLLWFLSQCAPHLNPGLTLHLCGLDRPLDGINLAAYPLAVVRHGFVDDVSLAVPHAAIAIAPVVSGGGVRIKNLLLASMGKAIVTTPLGNEGIGFVDARDAVVTDDGLEMARRINVLCQCPQEIARLGSSARAFVKAEFGHAAIVDRLEHEVLA